MCIARWAAGLRTSQNARQELSNWFPVLTRVATGRPVQELRLRRGGTLAAPRSADLWNHFNGIWLMGCYTADEPLSKGGVVIDIGANVGIFSLLAAPVADLVLALEPLREAFECLSRNVASVQADNVVCVNRAVAGKEGQALLRANASLTAGRLLSADLDERSAGSAQQVETVTLAGIFDEWSIASCAFLKLDCEGAEFEIFDSTPSEVFQRVHRVALEVHEEIAGRRVHEILDRLACEGFSTRSRPVGPGFALVSATRGAKV
jgi:FkbM family methyltransferase